MGALAGGAPGERALWLSLPLPFVDLSALLPAAVADGAHAPARTAAVLAGFTLPPGGGETRPLRPRIILPVRALCTVRSAWLVSPLLTMHRAQEGLEAVLGPESGWGAREWRPETCLVEFLPAATAALQVRALRSRASHRAASR